MFNLLFHYYVFVCILPGKAVPEMTYTVSGGSLNPTLSFTYFLLDAFGVFTSVFLVFRCLLHDPRSDGYVPWNSS